MPRQRIDDFTTTGFYAEVQWRPQQENGSGHVQVASINQASPFEFPEVDTGDHFEAAEKFDGWRVTLDEKALTQLISTLHKAKRQAFPKMTA